MYHHLRGRILDRADGRVVVEVGGVGYEVLCPRAEGFPSGDEVRILTYLHVREDVLRLYGFSTEDEREVFLALISVNGVGPVLGCSVLSELTPSEVRTAVVARDPAPLQRVKGVGRKTAERILLDLQGRLGPPREIGAPAAGTCASTEDAVAALVSLGYPPAVAGRAVAEGRRELGHDAPLQELVRAGLNKVKS